MLTCCCPAATPEWLVMQQLVGLWQKFFADVTLNLRGFRNAKRGRIIGPFGWNRESSWTTFYPPKIDHFALVMRSPPLEVTVGPGADRLWLGPQLLTTGWQEMSAEVSVGHTFPPTDVPLTVSVRLIHFGSLLANIISSSSSCEDLAETRDLPALSPPPYWPILTPWMTETIGNKKFRIEKGKHYHIHLLLISGKIFWESSESGQTGCGGWWYWCCDAKQLWQSDNRVGSHLRVTFPQRYTSSADSIGNDSCWSLALSTVDSLYRADTESFAELNVGRIP